MLCGDNKLIILSVILFVENDTTKTLKHNSSLDTFTRLFACIKEAALFFHSSAHLSLRLEVSLHPGLTLLLDLKLALLVRTHGINPLLQLFSLFLLLLDLLNRFGKEEIDVTQTFANKRLELVNEH